MRYLISLIILTTSLFAQQGGLMQIPVASTGASPAGSLCAIQTYATSSTLGGAAGDGCLVLAALGTPPTPVITNQGAAGATTYGYKVVANTLVGNTCTDSANVPAICTAVEGTTATGNATLTGSNFNRITWTAAVGATSYTIWKTTDPGGNTGPIGTTSSLTLDDTGATLGGDNPADTNTTRGQALGYNLKLNGHMAVGNLAQIDYTNPLFFGGFGFPILSPIGIQDNLTDSYPGMVNMFTSYYGNYSIIRNAMSSKTGIIIHNYDGEYVQASGTGMANDSVNSFQEIDAGSVAELIGFKNFATFSGLASSSGDVKGASVAFAMGGTSSVTGNWTGYEAADPTGAALGNLTGNFAGFRSLLNVGANRWAFYGAGTAASYFGGQIQDVTDIANPFLLGKTTQSAAAPGAGKADLRWLAGTNTGTCKLVANAGTSATEVTIIDNVGGGC